MAKPFVAVLMGSDSDLPVMEGAIKTLKSLGVAVEARVTSAHRTPEATHAYVKDAEQRGCGVFIAAAGMAAHQSCGKPVTLSSKPNSSRKKPCWPVK